MIKEPEAIFWEPVFVQDLQHKYEINNFAEMRHANFHALIAIPGVAPNMGSMQKVSAIGPRVYPKVVDGQLIAKLYSYGDVWCTILKFVPDKIITHEIRVDKLMIAVHHGVDIDTITDVLHLNDNPLDCTLLNLVPIYS